MMESAKAHAASRAVVEVYQRLAHDGFPLDPVVLLGVASGLLEMVLQTAELAPDAKTGVERPLTEDIVMQDARDGMLAWRPAVTEQLHVWKLLAQKGTSA